MKNWLIKNLPNSGDTETMGLVLGLGRSPERRQQPLQFSCLETLWTDRAGGWVGRITKESDT